MALEQIDLKRGVLLRNVADRRNSPNFLVEAFDLNRRQVTLLADSTAKTRIVSLSFAMNRLRLLTEEERREAESAFMRVDIQTRRGRGETTKRQLKSRRRV